MKRIPLLTCLSLCLFAISSCEDEKTTVDQTSLPVINIDSFQKVNMEGKASIVYTIKSDGGSPSVENGVCYSDENDLPVITDGCIKSDGTGTGTYTVNLSGLGVENDYYARIYARNQAGLVYSDPIILRAARGVCEVETSTERTDLAANSVTLHGTITDVGGDPEARGIIYIGRDLPFDTESWTKYESTTTGTGEFTVDIEGLRSYTTYYYVAAAINDKGENYGEVKEFVTLPGKPEAGTPILSDKRARGAFIATDIFDGGEKLTKIMLYVGEESAPETGTEIDVSEAGTPHFVTMNKPSTTYYIRVYAENQYGSSYGEEITYTTTAEGTPQNPIEVDGITYPVIRWGGYDILAKNLQVFKDNIGTEINQARVCTHPGESTKPGIGEKVGCFYRFIQAERACEYVAEQTGEAWKLPSATEWGDILNALEEAYGAPSGYPSHNGDFTSTTVVRGWKGNLAGRVACNAPDGIPSLSGLDITVGGITGNGNANIGSWNNASAESRSGMWTSSEFPGNKSEHYWREFRYRSASNPNYPEPKFCDQVYIDKIGNYSFNVRCVKVAK